MSSNNNSSSAGIGFWGATYNRLYRAETDKDDCVVMVVGSCSHLGSGSNCNHCFCGFHRPRGRVNP